MKQARAELCQAQFKFVLALPNISLCHFSFDKNLSLNLTEYLMAWQGGETFIKNSLIG